MNPEKGRRLKMLRKIFTLCILTCWCLFVAHGAFAQGQDASSSKGRSQNTVESARERAEAFAARESQRAEELAGDFDLKALVSGTGTTTYTVQLTDNGGGFAQLAWAASNSLGSYVTGQYDWIGVFTNQNQALVNPNSNFLGGNCGWQWASAGSAYTACIALQPGQVAAYVVKNAAGQYVTVAVTPPWPG